MTNEPNKRRYMSLCEKCKGLGKISMSPYLSVQCDECGGSGEKSMDGYADYLEYLMEDR